MGVQPPHFTPRSYNAIHGEGIVTTGIQKLDSPDTICAGPETEPRRSAHAWQLVRRGHKLMQTRKKILTTPFYDY
jgi:hypothetical protein